MKLGQKVATIPCLPIFLSCNILLANQTGFHKFTYIVINISRFTNITTILSSFRGIFCIDIHVVIWKRKKVFSKIKTKY